MLKSVTIFFCMCCHTFYAQSFYITGRIKDNISQKAITNASITISGAPNQKLTDSEGLFSIAISSSFLGEQELYIVVKGYEKKRLPIVVNENESLNLGTISLERLYNLDQELFTITLSDDALDNAINDAGHTSNLLGASLDVFQRTAAFEFGQSFFRRRGLDAANATVLINGITMNKIRDGRPQWRNWGGLNDVTRQQESVAGIAASSYSYGGILGVTHINTRASEMRKGGRVTYSSSNRSYSNRIMTTYASGPLKQNWAYAFSLGRRWGDQGFQDATLYDANSFFMTVEKQVHKAHSLNFTGIYTPNRQGQVSPNTQEVFNIKGIQYNAYWGNQDGVARNSRIREVNEPILMLNHYWGISSKMHLHTNVAYQFGERSGSRLDNNGTDIIGGVASGGAANPSPTYYQNLPSYFERNFPDDLQFAFLALRDFQDNGQINWNTFYDTNLQNTQNGGNAIYALYKDVEKDRQLSFSTQFQMVPQSNITIDAGCSVQHLNSRNYAEVADLFGAQTYLDVDRFADNTMAAQNDLQKPNRLVREGDAFKYNYTILTKVLNGFSQLQWRNNAFDIFIAVNANTTQYQREGVFQNGAFPDRSLGKGNPINFTGFGVKGGLAYNISGKQTVSSNLSYSTRAPFVRDVYTNIRENFNTIPNLTETQIRSADVNYNFRSAHVKARLTGYYTKIENANEVSFFFADGIGGDNVAFVQEILQGVNKQHIGLETGIELQILPTLKLKGVAALGQFTYANNPNLFLTTEADDASIAAGFVNGFRNFGVSQLKHYKLASGPQRAYALGFEYRDPEYWWLGVSANFLSHTYVDVSPLTRSSNFLSDFDGNAFNDFDPVLARELLQQERFKSYMVVNLTGGKSWKVGKRYVSVFANVNNLLDEVFRTGGFEQARNANFRQLRDDNALRTPVFANKYWYGRGTTYFLNLSYKF